MSRQAGASCKDTGQGTLYRQRALIPITSSRMKLRNPMIGVSVELTETITVLATTLIKSIALVFILVCARSISLNMQLLHVDGPELAGFGRAFRKYSPSVG